MKSRNPVLPLKYHCPDGEPHYIDGELFVYPSYDQSPKGYCSNKLFVAHSKDLSEWTVDGPAFESGKLDWELTPCYPAGLPEANGYEELPNYIKDYLPKHIGWFVPFKWFKGFLMWIVVATLRWPIADGLACPGKDGYNDQKEERKRHPFSRSPMC